MGSSRRHGALAFGAFRLEPDGTLCSGGETVSLAPRELALLRALTAAPGRTVSKEELLARLWGGEDVGEASLTTCVHGLRRALGDAGRRGGYVETVHGRGYRFAGAVRELPDRPGGTIATRVRVAVAPFACERSMRFLGEGLAGEITSRLGRWYDEGIGAIARQTTRRFADVRDDPLPLARELRLDVLVTGSLALGDGSVRLQLEVMRVCDGELVWSERFARPIAEQMLLAGEIAEGIAKRLAPEARRVPAAGETTPLTRDPRAYHTLLQGQFLGQSRTERGTHRAIECFRKALEWDPDCAAAHAALAEAHLALGFRGYESPREMAPVVKAEAARALEIDPHQPSARIALAFLRMALDRDPHIPDEVRSLPEPFDPAQERTAWLRSQVLTAYGFPDEALEVLQKARSLNPFAPNLAIAEGFALWSAGRTPEALGVARRLVASDPDFAVGHGLRACVASALGRDEEALAAAGAGDAIARNDQLTRSACAWASARSGAPELARAALARLVRIGRHRYVAPSFVALIHVSLGDATAALAWLERALEQRCLWLPYVAVDPRFESLRASRRFRALTNLAGSRPGPLPTPRSFA